MQTIVIDTQSFIRGESKSVNSNDGGFSPLTKNINLIKTRIDGALHGTPTPSTLVSDLGTNQEPIAGIFDPAFGGNDAFFVTKGGLFYKINSGSLTLGATDSTNSYTEGTTSIKYFKNEVFATTTQQIVKLSSSLGSLDDDWWTVTRGHGSMEVNYRHPMEVVEDTLFIADRYYIHTWDGTTSVSQAMSLPPDVNITSLVKHPDGRHLIAFCGVTANYSHTRTSGGRVYIIDTVNLEWVQEIIIEAQVEGSLVQGGVVYTTYGKNFGYFNGSGLVWLRNLTSSYTYSNCLTTLDDVVVIRDNYNVICYGDVGAGKVFWNMYEVTEASTNGITFILGMTAKKLIYGYRTASAKGALQQIDLDGTEGGARIVTNQISGGVRTWVRRIDVEQDNVATYVGTYFFYWTPDGAQNTITNIDQNSGATATVPRHYRINCNVLGDNNSFEIKQTSNYAPIYKITLYAEAYE